MIDEAILWLWIMAMAVPMFWWLVKHPYWWNTIFLLYIPVPCDSLLENPPLLSILSIPWLFVWFSNNSTDLWVCSHLTARQINDVCIIGIEIFKVVGTFHDTFSDLSHDNHDVLLLLTSKISRTKTESGSEILMIFNCFGLSTDCSKWDFASSAALCWLHFVQDETDNNKIVPIIKSHVCFHILMILVLSGLSASRL